jgi:hypothetical protein
MDGDQGMVATPDQVVVSTAFLAHLFDVSPSTIAGWAARGMPCERPGQRGVRAQFNLGLSVRWWGENIGRPPCSHRILSRHVCPAREEAVLTRQFQSGYISARHYNEQRMRHATSQADGVIDG